MPDSFPSPGTTPLNALGPQRLTGRRAGQLPLLRLALLLPLALLAGCGTLAPDYEQPQLPVSAAYPLDAPLPAGGTPPAQLAWQDYFTDPQLRHLIASALTHNRDLRSAVLRVEEARASYGIRRADRFPTVGLAIDATRGRTPADLSLTGKAEVAGQYEAGLGISSWELDFWGRVRSLEDAALQEYLATEAARQAFAISLVAQVADAYLTLRELDERIRLARETVASREESFRIFNRRYQVGATSRLDLTQVETLLAQAQTLGVQLEQSRAAQAHALAELVGAPLELAAAPGLDRDGGLQVLRPGLPAELLTSRPDIMAAERRLKAANASIGAARAAFFPRITLTTSAGTASAELEGLFDAGSGSWRFMPSLSLPLFDAGRNRANLELAEVRRDLAVASYEKTVQTAFREVADALSAQRWLGEQLRILQGSLATQAERARLAQLRYDNGAARYLEVLDAQRELLSAQQQVVQTRRALLSSQVALYAALGGGSAAASPATTATTPLPTE
ncbi:AdeC/AdeK/OprM family multidrug efflux complex outer membrane factor [Azoarcus indigens]|uniref:Multidrug efflux system outer membrane protein n=1 Tax=Azoarcus indigens TaxID=29545 RepID=A0A4V3BMP3_9RHOO|nr:AdeC/AdeK/OprM family multidrug efflux complex outer membrane factor [Azoarcus indigens]NMG64693.1 AdeC/AdeK/OprM family multidrug efflux complex outer membrane factor [Azoarcus indigens]TDN50922.1 multidrug efflux system outer membrane protein [Azoarcus indigens]